MRLGLEPRHTAAGSVSPQADGWRLSIPAGPRHQYRLAQLDDYGSKTRRQFPHSAIDLAVAARLSGPSIPGTWGFGLWNDPFALRIGLRRNSLRLPALPNAAWFFHASPESYLSFRDAAPARGFLAQVFRSPRFPARLFPAAILLPLFPRTARRMLQKAIDEDGISLHLDMTDWHRYRVVWTGANVQLSVDDVPVLTTSVSPAPPLGLVIWIDNQYARFTPEGRIRFGTLENHEPAWLEIRNLSAEDSQN